MNTSEHIDAIATALVAVQAKLENVAPGASGQFGSYLTLGDVLNAVRPVLTENGIAVIQSPGLDVGNEGGKVVDRVTLTTRLIHTSGQWIQGTAARAQTAAEWITEKQASTLSPVQLAGNVITYLRRYSLAAMVGVAQADNDGAAPAVPGQVRSLGTVATPPVQPAPATADPVATAGEVFDGAAPSSDAAPAERHLLQDTILTELSRVNAEPEEFEAALKLKYGVLTMAGLTLDQLHSAIAELRKLPTPGGIS